MRYDYKCRCGYKFEQMNSVANRHTAICPKCGESAELHFSVKGLSTSIQVFKPYIDHHIDSYPTYIESKKQKRELLKKNNLEQL